MQVTRLILFILLVFAPAMEAQMMRVIRRAAAASFIPIQGSSGANGSTTDVSTGAFTSTTTAGNSIHGGCAVYGSSVTFGTVTDTAGDTFVVETPYQSGSINTVLFHAYNITAHASNVVTCNFTGGVFENVIAAEEFSGEPTSGAVDKTTNAPNSSTMSWVSGTTGATTQASELAIGWFVLLNSGTAPVFTQGSSWTSVQAGNSGTTYAFMLEYKALSSTGTQQATAALNANGSGTGQIATYK